MSGPAAAGATVDGHGLPDVLASDADARRLQHRDLRDRDTCELLVERAKAQAALLELANERRERLIYQPTPGSPMGFVRAEEWLASRLRLIDEALRARRWPA